jgi:hypothetical protein
MCKLATIDSREKTQLLVQEVLTSKNTKLFYPSVWIGLTSLDSQPTTDLTRFRWLSGAGDTSSYENWSSFTEQGGRRVENPDNAGGWQGVCVTAVGPDTCCSPVGAWDDESCQQRRPFVCEAAMARPTKPVTVQQRCKFCSQRPCTGIIPADVCVFECVDIVNRQPANLPTPHIGGNNTVSLVWQQAVIACHALLLTTCSSLSHVF